MTQDNAQNTKGFVQLSSSTLMQELEGETVLLDLVEEVYFSLDEVGTDMLRTVQQSETLGGAVDALVELYDIDRVTLQEDLCTLLEQLRDAGLVEGKW